MNLCMLKSLDKSNKFSYYLFFSNLQVASNKSSWFLSISAKSAKRPVVQICGLQNKNRSVYLVFFLLWNKSILKCLSFLGQIWVLTPAETTFCIWFCNTVNINLQLTIFLNSSYSCTYLEWSMFGWHFEDQLWWAACPCCHLISCLGPHQEKQPDQPS